MEKIKSLNTFRKTLVVLLIAFAAWNLLWLAHLLQFRSLGDNMEHIEFRRYYISDETFLYYLIKPSYLSFNGNVTCGYLNELPFVIIWPGLFGDEYGVSLGDSENMKFVQFYTDKYGQIKAGYDEETELMASQNKEYIDSLFSHIYAFWPQLEGK